MKTVVMAPSNREFGRPVGNELSEIWQEVVAASPRDQIEFGAKALGFSGDAGSFADVSLRQDSPSPGGVSSEPRPVSRFAASVEVIHVTRGAKADWASIQLSKGLPPRGSLEWSRLTQKRIGYLSAALALLTMGVWGLAILHHVPNSSRASGTGVTALLLMLMPLYTFFYFFIDWVFGKISGSTAMARKYMAQVYPPRTRREN
jgi:hypothetical protein